MKILDAAVTDGSMATAARAPCGLSWIVQTRGNAIPIARFK